MPGIVEPELLEEPEPAPNKLLVDDTPPRPYVIFKQHVEIDIDFARKRVRGRSHILVVPIEPDVTDVYIDARHCEIDLKNITVSNCPVRARYHDPCDTLETPDGYMWTPAQWHIRKKRMEPLLHHRRKEVPVMAHDLACCQPLDGALKVTLPSAEEVKKKNRDASKAEQQELLIHADGNVQGYRVTVPFELNSVYNGLHFVGIDEGDTRYPHVYTRHSVEPGTACSIFPCIDDPGCRNPWKISITCPRTLGDAFDQPRGSKKHSKNQNGLKDKGKGKAKPGKEEPVLRDYRLSEEDKQLEMTVVCSGFLTGEVINRKDQASKTMTFEVDNNKAAKHIGFAVGPFEHVDLWSEFRSEEDDTKLGVSAAKVHGYCLPGRAEEVKNTCASLVTAVDHFVLHFGRYPFENYKVCFVDDMVEDATPLCAFSLCSSRLLYPSDIIDTEVETTRTLVYSLASQWFGVNIVPNTKADIWLVVGIAWFMTDYFMKALCGNNAFRFRMKTMADRIVQLDMKRPSLQDLGEYLYLGDYEVEFMNLKAPLVLFILDRRLSKSSGSAGISRIISRMVSKANTSTQANDDVLPSDSFRKACEKVGSTRLESFWNQWVVGSGCPRFNVLQRFNKKKLCVEMHVYQVQDEAAVVPRAIDKNDFWRQVRENAHAVNAGELQSFTGPMTIRIHEADGTPYEHIVEIRDASAKVAKFEIPYNTKYKRLKRNRRQRERAMANNNAKEEGQKELYYLGDVFQHPDEMEEWGFRDWDEETEGRMDQESYEWIRMDADFEWICEMTTNMPPYMYASQLQQDRDVAAQEDTMLFLKRSFDKSGAHPLVSTILTRTLLDPRYFYGIRLLAAEELPRHGVPGQVDWIGFKHLQKAFQHFFCMEGTLKVRPNNFADKRQYMIQCAIPEAIARVRGEDGKCPKEARRFLLGLLQENNNSENAYSDQFYICKLIHAIALCQVPSGGKKDQPPMQMSLSFGDGDDEDELMADEADVEPEEFRELALEEIERYRRRDEYASSYQNCFTVAALDALCLLMKAEVIPPEPLKFVQYIHDRTADVVRIKACEAMIELGFLSHPRVTRLFFTILSTDPSPFVRDQYFKLLCRGVASIAIGEKAEEPKETADPIKDGDLVVEQDGSLLQDRQWAKTRKEELPAALVALKKEISGNEALQQALWESLDSPVLTVTERINLLELCSLLVDEDTSLPIKMRLPEEWSVSCKDKVPDVKYVLNFRKVFRTKSRGSYATRAPSPPPPRPEPKRTILLNLHKTPNTSKTPSINKTTSISTKPVVPATSRAPSVTSKPVVPAASRAPSISSKPVLSAANRAPSTSSKPVLSAASPPQASPAVSPTPPHSTATHTQSKKSISLTSSKSSAGSPTPGVLTPKHSSSTVTVAVHKTATSHHEDKVLKNGEPRRDTSSVQSPVRPTPEARQPEQKPAAPKLNGGGNLIVKPQKHTLKRPSADGDTVSDRPSKLIKLDTKNIRDAMKKLKPSSGLITVKFTAWDRLKLHKKSLHSGTMRPASKNPLSSHKKSTSSSHHATLPGSSRPVFGATSRIHKATPPPQSRPRLSTPTSSSHHPASSQPGGSGGKPRKPLPDMMRRPLPSAAPNAHPTTSKPPASAPSLSKHLSSGSNHSKPGHLSSGSSHSKSHTPGPISSKTSSPAPPPSKAPPPAPKPATKFKIKVKTSS